MDIAIILGLLLVIFIGIYLIILVKELIIKYQILSEKQTETLDSNLLSSQISTIVSNNISSTVSTNVSGSVSKNILVELLNKIADLKLGLTDQINSKSNASSVMIQEKLDTLTLNILRTTTNELTKLGNTTKDQLGIINLDVQKRLDENFARNLKSFEEVSKNLGQMEQKAQSMIESTKSIDKLNAIFSRTSSKSFGTFSEDYLESMLTEHLMQGSFKSQVSIPQSSDKIDFVITINGKNIGIDSKFPLTKYQDYLDSDTPNIAKKQLQNTILAMAKDISAKYYKQAFIDKLYLYLPSDSIYLLCMEDDGTFHKQLRNLKVTLISPNTLYPQLVLIANLQFQLNVSQNAENIIRGLKEITRNISSFREEYRKLGDKIRQAQTNYDQANNSLSYVERGIMELETKEVEEHR
jgi:DNA recombination protein RmuC